MPRLLAGFVVSVLLATPLAAGWQGRTRLPARSPIEAKFLQLGSDRGFLGRPTTEERPTPGSARERWRRWSLLPHFNGVGWERSFLGYPRGEGSVRSLGVERAPVDGGLSGDAAEESDASSAAQLRAG